MAFSRAHRQAIVEDFCRRHNGLYSPDLFLREVQEMGEDHPAFSWFLWDDEDAANEHRLWQARTFVSDLRIKFSVETVNRKGAIRVLVSEAPYALSPVSSRNSGGGYYVTDLNDPSHIAELTRQAATSLQTWLRRYGSCSPPAAELIEKAISLLDVSEERAA